jgi:hypothetical protein
VHRTTNIQPFSQSHSQQQHRDAHDNIKKSHLGFSPGFERPDIQQEKEDEGTIRPSPQPIGCNINARNLHDVSLLPQASKTTTEPSILEHVGKATTTARPSTGTDMHTA